MHKFFGFYKNKIPFALLICISIFIVPRSTDAENDDGNFSEWEKIPRKIKTLYKATTQQNNYYRSISSIFSIVIKVSRHSRNATNMKKRDSSSKLIHSNILYKMKCSSYILNPVQFIWNPFENLVLATVAATVQLIAIQQHIIIIQWLGI